MDNLIDILSKFLAERKELFVEVYDTWVLFTNGHVHVWLTRCLFESTRDLEVLSAIVVPLILVLLEDNKVDGLNRILGLIDPLEDKLQGAIFRVE